MQYDTVNYGVAHTNKALEFTMMSCIVHLAVCFNRLIKIKPRYIHQNSHLAWNSRRVMLFLDAIFNFTLPSPDSKWTKCFSLLHGFPKWTKGQFEETYKCTQDLYQRVIILTIIPLRRLFICYIYTFPLFKRE